MEFANKRVTETEEYELWLSSDKMVHVYIRQLSCAERDYLYDKYSALLEADDKSLSFFEIMKKRKYPYEVISMALVKPKITIDQLQELDIWTFSKLYNLVLNVLGPLD